MTDNGIRTETILTVLRKAGKIVDDALITTMILNGLPMYFDRFSIDVTQSNKEVIFSEFKTEFHNFEETLKYTENSCINDVMNFTSTFSKSMKNENRDRRDISCFTCGEKRHLTKICPHFYNKRRKPWCNYCKSTTYRKEPCRYKWRDTIKKKRNRRGKMLVRIQNRRLIPKKE